MAPVVIAQCLDRKVEVITEDDSATETGARCASVQEVSGIGALTAQTNTSDRPPSP